MILYRLTFSNGKCYIGQTVRMLETRILQHKQAANRGSMLAVHCAWRKHGTPVVDTLGVYGHPQDLHAAERSHIEMLNTLIPSGYNLSYGGDTSPARNPFVAAKISKATMGRVISEEHKQAIRDARLWDNPEYRAKVAAGVKAYWTPEARAALSKRTKGRGRGRKLTAEARAKIRDKANNMSEETRAKMSAAAKARVRKPWSEEVRAKMADSARKAHARNGSDHRGLAIKAAHAARSPEERSAAAKKAWETKRLKKEDAHG